MAAIVQKFGSGPVGVAAIAAVLAEEVETIEDVYEPYLLRLGFMDRTPQGRIRPKAAGRTCGGTATRFRRRAGRTSTCPPCGTAPSTGPPTSASGRTPCDRERARREQGHAATFEVVVPPPADGSTRAGWAA